MTEKEMTKHLREEIEKEMPDMLSKIEEDCQSTPQLTAFPSKPKKKKYFTAVIGAVAACFVLFSCGLFTGLFVPKTPEGNQPSPKTAETVIYMDVNPSIELTLDSEGKVLSCTAGNEDANLILSELDLCGSERDTALTAILGAMYINGYLSEESNAVLVSVDGIEEEPSEAMLKEITEKINSVFKESPISCSIITQAIDAENDLISKARELDVSLGKICLIQKLVKALELINENDIASLAGLSVGELNLMYSNASKENGSFSGDVVSGTLGGYVNTEDAISLILDYIGEESRFYEVTRTENDCIIVDGQTRIVYCVTVKSTLLFEKAYSFTVDCKTGEFLDSDINFGFIDSYRL